MSEPSDGHPSYWTLVNVNAVAIRDFLQWSAACEASADTSLRWRARGDLREAREVIPLFEDPWWAIVVYTCFNSTVGTQAVSDRFHRPLPVGEAQVAAASITLPAGSVGMHRIQPGHVGARRALVAACGQADSFRTILYSGVGFDDRYASLRAIGAASWGRTTCYDLLLRAGALGVANGLSTNPSSRTSLIRQAQPEDSSNCGATPSIARCASPRTCWVGGLPTGMKSRSEWELQITLYRPMGPRTLRTRYASIRNVRAGLRDRFHCDRNVCLG